MKSLCLPILKRMMGIVRILRAYMMLGDAVSKLETFVWIFNCIARFRTWSLFTLKASYLVKQPIFHVVVSVYRLKFETRPSSLLNFRTAYFSKYFENVWITLDFSCDCQTMSRIAWHRFMNMNTLFLCWIVHKWRYMQTNIKCSCESNSRLGFHSSKHIWGHESLHQHFPGHILLWK